MDSYITQEIPKICLCQLSHYLLMRTTRTQSKCVLTVNPLIPAGGHEELQEAVFRRIWCENVKEMSILTKRTIKRGKDYMDQKGHTVPSDLWYCYIVPDNVKMII